MACSVCSANVEKKLQSLEGINSASVSLASRTALVDYDPDMSMDHNTRVTAELAIAMTRMWELEAIQTLGAGNAGVVDAATVAEERRYMDFTLPSLTP